MNFQFDVSSEGSLQSKAQDPQLRVAPSGEKIVQLGLGLSGQHLLQFQKLVAPDFTPTYLPLEHDFTDSTRVDLDGSLDRLNLRFDFDSIRVVAGRQAVTWGVTYFWPALDLFAPFSPRRVDRDYKPGIDAIRAIIPWGDYSELEVIGGVLGPSLQRDGTLGALARIYLGPVDVGLMGGKFHRDTVVGGFFTAGEEWANSIARWDGRRDSFVTVVAQSTISLRWVK